MIVACDERETGFTLRFRSGRALRVEQRARYEAYTFGDEAGNLWVSAILER